MTSDRRAKIVCTLGPATSTPDQVAGLVAAGMDVARLNMSHGRQDSHLAVYQQVRAASDASGHSVGVLVDLQGPKIRHGTFAAGPVRLANGQEFTISVRPVAGDQHEASTTYPGLAGDVRPGDTVLVDDGRVVLEVTAVHGEWVHTTVITGGVLSDHKGLNLPGVKVSVPALTGKDEADLRWALRLRADLIALSFVQGPADADAVRRIMDETGTAAEQDYLRPAPSLPWVPTTTGGAIARAAAEVGAVAGARALVAFTITGETARRLARHRSPIPLLAFTPQPAMRSQLALSWGVETFIVPPARHTDEMVRQVEDALLQIGRCEKGDRVVIVAGSPPGTPGRTNALRVHTIGDAAALGAGLA